MSQRRSRFSRFRALRRARCASKRSFTTDILLESRRTIEEDEDDSDNDDDVDAEAYDEPPAPIFCSLQLVSILCVGSALRAFPFYFSVKKISTLQLNF